MFFKIHKRFAVRRAVSSRAFAVLLAGLLADMTARGQEALRASLTGEQAAETQKREAANANYNLKLGNLKLRFDTGLEIEASDNVNLTQTNRQADISIRPVLSTTMMLPVSERNTLIMTLGVGYAKYLRTSRLDHFFLTPNSTLSYDIYAGDFLINLHSRFTYAQDAYQQPEINNSGSYGYFEDISGVRVLCHLDKYIFSLSLDHDIYLTTSPQYQYQDHSTELALFSFEKEVNPTTKVGVQLGAGITAYDVTPNYTNQVLVQYEVTPTMTNFVGFVTNRVSSRTFLSGQKFLNFGPVLQTSLTPHFTARVSAGYAMYFQDTPSSFGSGGTIAAFYADVTLRHKPNDWLNYSLSVGHQVRQGLNSDTLDTYYARISPSWNVIRKITINTPLSYEHSSGAGSTGEIYDYLTMGIQASRQLTKKINLSAGYNFRMKSANVSINDYIQNQLVFNLHFAL